MNKKPVCVMCMYCTATKKNKEHKFCLTNFHTLLIIIHVCKIFLADAIASIKKKILTHNLKIYDNDDNYNYINYINTLENNEMIKNQQTNKNTHKVYNNLQIIF